jgi:GNAT superfamily N-acetyltransferase
MAARIDVCSPASPEALAVVDSGLDEFNSAHARLSDVRPLHVIASGAAGEVFGGAVGRTWGECCELQQLWVAAGHRNQGTGGQLLATFEREAIRRGCRLVYLDTFSFQAPAFYAARGYVEVLNTSGFTGDVVKSTMHKRLPEPGAEV